MSGTPEGRAAGDPAPGDGGRERLAPAQLIGEMHALRDRTSAAARGYWLPLLLFGALILGSLPLYERLASAPPGLPGPPGPGGCTAAVNHPCHGPAGAVAVHLTLVTALGYYWQLAIPAGVVATVLWYRWRGSRTGLRTPALGFLITGLILGELVLLVPLLAGQSASLSRLLHGTHQAGPLVIIAVLLWVLAWAERSPALAVITAGYLVVALAVSPLDNGGLAGGTTGAADLSLTAAVAGRGAGASAARRRIGDLAGPAAAPAAAYPCQRRFSQRELSTSNRPELTLWGVGREAGPLSCSARERRATGERRAREGGR